MSLEMRFLLFTLVASVVFTIAFPILRRLGRGSFVVSASTIYVVLAVLLVSWPLRVHSYLSLCAALCCSVLGWGTRGVLVSSGLAWLIAVVIVTAAIRRDALLIERLRAEFPFVSLDDRLAYETRRPPRPRASLSPRVEQRLALREESEWNHRRDRLRRVHEDATLAFEKTIGFGFRRMTIRHRNYLALPDGERLRLPLAPSADPYVEAEEAPVPNPPRVNVLTLHDVAEKDFLDPRRFGYRNEHGVAGFVSHRMVEVPGGDSWAVTRLELVSLLKHDRPVAYVSDELPRMEELDSAVTRPLDDFEARGLAALRTDEDLVVETNPSFVRMLGSLRAGKNCLECHSARRGELLGAFSYMLHPAQRVEPRGTATGAADK